MATRAESGLSDHGTDSSRPSEDVACGRTVSARFTGHHIPAPQSVVDALEFGLTRGESNGTESLRHNSGDEHADVIFDEDRAVILKGKIGGKGHKKAAQMSLLNPPTTNSKWLRQEFQQKPNAL